MKVTLDYSISDTILKPNVWLTIKWNDNIIYDGLVESKAKAYEIIERISNKKWKFQNTQS